LKFAGLGLVGGLSLGARRDISEPQGLGERLNDARGKPIYFKRNSEIYQWNSQGKSLTIFDYPIKGFDVRVIGFGREYVGVKWDDLMNDGVYNLWEKAIREAGKSNRFIDKNSHIEVKDYPIKDWRLMLWRQEIELEPDYGEVVPPEYEIDFILNKYGEFYEKDREEKGYKGNEFIGGRGEAERALGLD